MTSMTHGADFTRFETWKAKNMTFFARKKAVMGESSSPFDGRLYL